MPKSITGSQIQDSMVDNGIVWVDHHNCSICGKMVGYRRIENRIFFDPSCNCCDKDYPEPRNWDDIAFWINIQPSIELKNKIRSRFGLPLLSLECV